MEVVFLVRLSRSECQGKVSVCESVGNGCGTLVGLMFEVLRVDFFCFFTFHFTADFFFYVIRCSVYVRIC